MENIPEKSQRDQNFLKKNTDVILAISMSIPILYLYFFIALPAVDLRAQLFINTITFAIVYYVAALSLDLEVGSMGLPNFGKVAFIALGAYMVVILWEGIPVLGSSLGINGLQQISLPLAVFGSLIVCGFFGWIVAIPTVKLRADYFAIMTIAGGELIRLIVLNEKRYFWQTRQAGEFIIKEQLINFDFRRQFSKLKFFGIDFGAEISLKDLPLINQIRVFETYLIGIILLVMIILYFILKNISLSYFPETFKRYFYNIMNLLKEKKFKEVLKKILNLIIIVIFLILFIYGSISLVGSINNFLLDYGTLTIGEYFGSINMYDIILLIAFLIIVLIIYFIVELIRNAPYGRTLRAIREDDITVTSVGKDVFRFRYQVTIVAAVICGFAGFLWIMVSPVFEPNDFRPFVTFNLFVFVIIGGIGNSRGVAAGTFLISFFLRSVQVKAVRDQLSFTFGADLPVLGSILDFLKLEINVTPDDARLVIMGIILILFLLYKPSGLIPERKADNTRYLNLLDEEGRKRSDESIFVRQSVSEQERLGIREFTTKSDESISKVELKEEEKG